MRFAQTAAEVAEIITIGFRVKQKSNKVKNVQCLLNYFQLRIWCCGSGMVGYVVSSMRMKYN